MDDPTITSQRAMACWEQYLIPAIGDSLLTADLLCRREGDKKIPGNYRIVLSPSCDLARGGKVRSILVATCHSPSVMLEKFRSSVKPKNDTECMKQLSTLVLTQGSWNGWMPLPSFADILPTTVAYLKDLEVIALTSIGPSNSATHEFLRIASIDSPFREQVAWAYLTTAARPGMPERDLNPWAEEIMKAVAPNS